MTDTTIVPTNRKIVFADNLPSAKNNIITVIIKEYTIDDITPATKPFNVVSLEAKIPPKNPPNKTQATNIAPTESEIVSDFVNMEENTSEIIKHITTPIIAENIMPIIFFEVDDISLFFFNTFLRIKNPSHSLKNMRESFLL